MISQRTGEILIIIVVIIVSLYLFGNHHGGRGIDYQEQQISER